MASPELGGGAGSYDFHLRSLSAASRDSAAAADPASDPNLLQSVRRVCEMCREAKDARDEMVARAFPVMSKLFQRCAAAPIQAVASTGVLLLTILQFFLDFGEAVLHDADGSLKIFFRSCLSREFADPVVAERTLEFLVANKTKILSSFPTLIPQFYPLLLKLIASNGERLEKKFLEMLPLMMSAGSFLPLFLSLMDLPMLVVALEKVERSSGTLIGSSIATIQKSAAPEMLLALMDEAYTGSTIEDSRGNSGSDDSSPLDLADPMFLDLLKDENDGIAAKHWISPTVSSTLQAAVNSPQSDRLKQSLEMAPRFLSLYFAIALRDVNDSLLCALIPVVMSRYAAMFPDKVFSFEKPITDRLGEAHDNPAKTELALHLCWAIGEHGAGGVNRKDVARELFENLELLLYENLATSRLGLSQEPGFDSMGASSRKSSQARLLCFVVTAIAKLATCHSELLPRARVSLAKVARSRTSDRRVWQRACDYLGLMNEPAICLSVLGSSTAQGNGPGIVNWCEGGTKMVAHVPFYLLAEQKGPPFHDFSFADLLPAE
ncbi:AP-5 complex subunit zeta-1 isoform X2 [Panicum virgatum]|uniref:AP-5 complex subunit zeta-1 isoform X2 n=1 Tax=Panicum virgatum TaxID=38727 RepID=UPI0019D61F0F|nr:AP-5 complex subunit zeta-1 isoform X2 [Panicum virgatum]